MATKPDPLLQIAASLELCGKGLHRIADAIHSLGNGDKNGPGAIEGHSMTIRDALQAAAETLATAGRQGQD